MCKHESRSRPITRKLELDNRYGRGPTTKTSRGTDKYSRDDRSGGNAYLLLILKSFMINKTLVWNCRGVDSQGTLLQLKMLIEEHRPQVVALLKICMHSQNLFCYFHSTYLSNMIAREAQGYAGGIWLFWDREAVQLDGVTIHKHVVSVLVHEKNKHQWMLSIVCASLRSIVRKDLWRYNLDMGA